MEPYTYEQLKGMTVVQLREIVRATPNHESIEGFGTMHKDHLLPALCKLLGIHVHEAAAGAEKPRLKAAIKKLKARRDEALAAGNPAGLTVARRQIHVLKRKLRRLPAP